MNVRSGALATGFAALQFYTSFAALSSVPPVGYLFLGRVGAAVLVAAFAAAGVVCGALAAREGALLRPSASRAALGAWLGAALLAAVLGLDPPTALAVVAMMALTAAIHLGLVRWFGRPGVARAVVGTFLVTGIAASAFGLAAEIARRPSALWTFNHGRAAGVFVTANQFAAYLIVLGFVALGAALADGPVPRPLAASAALLAGAALVATLSFAALAGALAAGIWYALQFAAVPRRAVAALAVLAVVAIVAVGRGAHDPGEGLDRLRTWRAGARVAELFPLTGAGPMGYWRAYPAVRPPDGDPPGSFGALHPHNAYLSLAADTGIIGCIAFVYGTGRLVRAVRVALRARSRLERRFVLGVCAGLGAALVQGLFDTIGIVQMTFVWIPFAGLALAAATAGLPARNAA